MIYFTAHTFQCVCRCIRTMFRVLGVYNFASAINLNLIEHKRGVRWSNFAEFYMKHCYWTAPNKMVRCVSIQQQNGVSFFLIWKLHNQCSFNLKVTVATSLWFRWNSQPCNLRPIIFHNPQYCEKFDSWTLNFIIHFQRCRYLFESGGGAGS